MAELIAVLVFLFLALLLGYLRGVEKERGRICDAFVHKEDHTYEEFYDVLNNSNLAEQNNHNKPIYKIKSNKMKNIMTIVIIIIIVIGCTLMIYKNWEN
jgi:hypothetical protein|tara:strand:+ start:1166 stop:1462 length:297 start_codon:yes stop_codon:yes gene_type:complete